MKREHSNNTFSLKIASSPDKVHVSNASSLFELFHIINIPLDICVSSAGSSLNLNENQYNQEYF